MILAAKSARAIVNATYDAWSRGDVDGVLDQYADDLTFWSNVGGADGQPMVIVGKPAFRLFVQAIADTFESISVVEYFRLSGEVGRASVAYYLRHKQSKLTLTGSHRQVTTFRDGKILRAEQYHDAARTAAFWRLLSGDEPPQ